MNERRSYYMELSYTAEDVKAATRMSADGCPNTGVEIIAGAPIISNTAETTHNPHRKNLLIENFPLSNS